MRLQVYALFARQAHEVAEPPGLLHAEVEETRHVYVAESEARIDAGVRALAVDVVVIGGAGQGEDVAVTGAVESDAGEQGAASLLAFEDHAADAFALRN